MKNKILQLLIADLEKSVHSFENSIHELKSVSDIDENSTKDIEDFSHQDESKDMEMRYNLQLQKAKDDLTAVKQLIQKKNSSIAPGALIDAGSKWFFVGISNPAILVEDKELICFSTSAPVYKLLEGKAVGAAFIIGTNSYTIKAIY